MIAQANHRDQASAGNAAATGVIPARSNSLNERVYRAVACLLESAGRANVAPMLYSFLRTIVTVAVASMIVGTILAHFGITGHVLLRELHLRPEPIEAFLRHAVAWVLPNIVLGAAIIIPVWCLAYLLRPSGQGRE
jgi:hypothetical protein